MIELAVAVAVIAILAAVAVPTFLNLRAGAQDAIAQSALRNIASQGRSVSAITNAELLTFVGTGSEDFAEILKAFEPAYLLTLDGVDEPNEVSLVWLSPEHVAYAALSPSGTCWYAADQLDRGVRYARADDPVSCSASNFVLLAPYDEGLGPDQISFWAVDGESFMEASLLD